MTDEERQSDRTRRSAIGSLDADGARRSAMGSLDADGTRRTTHSLRVICRPSTRDGFALAGVRGLAAVDGTEAAAILHGLVEQPEPGVIFVEESLYRALPDALRTAIERRAVPIVIPFPGPRSGAAPSAELELVDMLRVAIGHRVRLR